MPELKTYDFTNRNNISWGIDHSDNENPTGLQLIGNEENRFRNILNRETAWPTKLPIIGSRKDFSKVVTYVPHHDTNVQQPYFAEVYLFEHASKIEIKLEGETVCYLDPRLEELSKEIEKSKYMLSLEDDFDEDGSEGYKTETWIRAINFLCQLFDFTLSKSTLELPIPKIFHGPSGSIDIFWENNEYNILVNIPKLNILFGTYSGENNLGEKVKGQFDPSRINYGIVLLFSVIK